MSTEPISTEPIMGSVISIHYLDRTNLMINEKQPIKGSYRDIKIDFDSQEISALRKSSDDKYIKIGQVNESSIKFKELDEKAFKIIKVYDAGKRLWQDVYKGGFDKLREILWEDVYKGGFDKPRETSADRDEKGKTTQAQKEAAKDTNPEKVEKKQEGKEPKPYDVKDKDAIKDK